MADASAIINILAFSDGIGLDEDIELVVPPAYDSEVLYVFIDDKETRVKVTDSLLAAARMTLTRSVLSTPETIAYVRFAALVDDGEAQTIAVAQGRSQPLLTDDVAGLRVAMQIGLPTVTTLDLAVSWSHGRSVKAVKEACRRLRLRGHYGIPRLHAHADWYRQNLDKDPSLSTGHFGSTDDGGSNV